MKFLPPSFKTFHISFTKFVFSFGDVAEGETDKGDGNNIENPMGFVFLLWLQVFRFRAALRCQYRNMFE